jgi:hypothetical protein
VTTSTTIYVPTTYTTVQTTVRFTPVTITGSTTIYSTITDRFTTVTTTSVPVVVLTTLTLRLTDTVTRPPTTVTETALRSISACPAPTNAAPAPPPNPTSDLTWGCKPGTVCSPPKPAGCNVWADSPADSYVCKPSECIPAPPFNKVTWPEDSTSYYPPTDGYFNLDPRAFGLSFEIFEQTEVVTVINGRPTTIITGNWVSQTGLTHYPPVSTAKPTKRNAGAPLLDHRDVSLPPALHRLAKRDDTITPAVCFDDCNNCYLEAQSVGKSPALCSSGSAFQSLLSTCNSCIAANTPSTLVNPQRTYVDPKFSQFLDYCSGTAPQPVVVTSTATAAPVTSTPPPPVVVTVTPTTTVPRPPPSTTTLPAVVTTAAAAKLAPSAGATTMMSAIMGLLAFFFL